MSLSVSAAFRPSRTELVLTALAILALCLLTFRLPDRDGPEAVGSLDLLAIAKLAVRMCVIGGVLLAWRSVPDKLGKQEVFSAYFPLIVFLAWAFITALWSPLKVVSLGQALGLSALLCLSAWVALICRNASSAATIFRCLWMTVTAYSTIVVIFHFVQPELAGLDRAAHLEGAASGMIHPTEAGSTASLGLLLTFIGPKLIPGIRFGILFAPSVAIHTTLLYLAQSRAALGMTAIVLAIVLLRHYSTNFHAKALVIASLGICAYLLVDPGFVWQEERLQDSMEYVSRGQTSEQLQGVSGRAEMWQAVWQQFQLSPWIGHGYFVTSETGRLDVWEGPANHTAHNLVLQVLVSTGIVGLALLLLAGAQLLFSMSSLRYGTTQAKGIFLVFTLVGMWYLGWSQTCISFLGPILPESVVFFVLLGLAVGQVVEVSLLTRAPNRPAA